jgi:ribosomal protein L40E
VGLSVENFRIVALLSLVLVGAAIALMLTRQKKVPGRPVRETVQLPVKPPPEEIPIETPVAQPVGLTKFCRECGAKIPKDSVFCEECGMNLAEAEKKVESRARSSSVRTRRGRIKWKLTSEILVIFGITNILWPLTAGRSYFEAIKAVGGNQNFLLIELVLGLLFIVPAIIYDLRRK